jgi:hypothetical protein
MKKDKGEKEEEKSKPVDEPVVEDEKIDED